MAQDWYIGIGGKARRVVAAYVGVGGKARRITSGYFGVGGKARQFWSDGSIVEFDKTVSWPRDAHSIGVPNSSHIIWGLKNRDSAYNASKYIAYDKNFVFKTVSQYTNPIEWGGDPLQPTKWASLANKYAIFHETDMDNDNSGSVGMYIYDNNLVDVGNISIPTHLTGKASVCGSTVYIGFGSQGGTLENDSVNYIDCMTSDLVLQNKITVSNGRRSNVCSASTNKYAMFLGGTGGPMSSSTHKYTAFSCVDVNGTLKDLTLPKGIGKNSYAFTMDKRTVYYFNNSDRILYSVNENLAFSSVGNTSTTKMGSYRNTIATDNHIIYFAGEQIYSTDKNLVTVQIDRPDDKTGGSWGAGYWQKRAMFNATSRSESSGNYTAGIMYTFKG